MSASYPWFTPYQFSSNDPIRNTDLDGLEGISEIEYLMNMAAQSLGIPTAPQTEVPQRPAGEPLNSNTKAVASLIPNEPAPPANNNSNDKPVLNNPSARDIIVTTQTNTPQQGDPLISTEILPTASGTLKYGRYHGRPGGKHQGVDLKADVGTPIYAPYDGKFAHKIILSHKQGVWFDGPYKDGLIAEGKDYDDAGNRIYLISTVDGDKIKTAYFHISQIAINPQTGKNYQLGDEVKQGDIIGYTGSTGSANGPGSGGPHLHYEMWINDARVDPEEHMKTKYDKKNGKPLTVQ